jgi:hypothetical protein
MQIVLPSGPEIMALSVMTQQQYAISMTFSMTMVVWG